MAKKIEKHPNFLATREVEAREEAHIASGGAPRVFFHPGRSANGTLEGLHSNSFQPHQAPAGWEYDVDAWEMAGRTGPAKLRRVAAETVSSEDLLPAEQSNESDAAAIDVLLSDGGGVFTVPAVDTPPATAGKKRG